jgi:hypothetical protein
MSAKALDCQAGAVRQEQRVGALRMNTPGRAASGWWDSHNNALYLEKLVHQSDADEKSDGAEPESAKPALSLLWRPISFPRTAASKAREVRARAVPLPREATAERVEPS